MNQQASKGLWDKVSQSATLVIVAGIMYYAVAVACMYLSPENSHTSIWTANAFLLTFILRSPKRLTWHYLTAGIVANFAANITIDLSALHAIGYTLSYTVELLVPIMCINRNTDDQVTISEINHKTYTILTSIFLGCAASSLLVGIMHSLQSDTHYISAAFSWFTVSFLGMLSVLSVGLTVSHERINRFVDTKQLVEFSAVAAFTVAITFLSAQAPIIRYVVIMLPLLYCAFRFELFPTSLLCAITTATYIGTLYFLTGPASQAMQANNASLVSYHYFFLCLTFMPALILAILLEQRSKFQQQVSESEQKFRGAIEHSALGMGIASLSGRWMMVNNALCKITGYSEEDLIKLSLNDITHPDDLNADNILREKIIKNEIPSYQMEKRYIRKNGNIIWISLVVSSVHDEDGQPKYFVVQVESINTRKSMEAALQESEQRWKFALESGSQGVWDWDISNNRIYFSKTWKKILGYADSEIYNVTEEWFSRIHPDEKEHVLNQITEHTQLTSSELQCEHRLRCKNGQYKWVLTRGKAVSTNENNKATRMIGTCTDINQLKNAKAEADKLSQRLLMALESGKFGVWSIDLKKDYLEWDERMFELYGVNPEDFTNNYQAWEKCIHPEDLAKTVEEYYQALADIKPFHTEFRIVRKNNEIAWVSANAKVIRSADGEPLTMLGINSDISNEKRMILDLGTEKERLHTTLQAIGDAVIVTDQNGLITFINPVAEELIGVTAKSAIGKEFYQICQLVAENTGEGLEDPVASCLDLSRKQCIKEEGILINQLGMRHTVLNTASPIILPSGDLTGCVLVIQDVTVNRNLQKELQHQATHDVLTGLINRREVEHKIRGLVGNHRSTKNEHAIFFIDLDHFKIVNDTAGHAAGDELLRRIAQILSQTVRASDVVARLGGDEFAIILPECSAENAVKIAENIVEKIKDYKFLWKDNSYEVGASVGVVNFKPQSATIAELISRADIACYNAKHKGGNNVSVYEQQDKDTERYLSDVQLFPKITDALKNNGFKLYAQRIQPIQENSIHTPYHEILIRLKDKNGKLILPSAFLKTATRHKLITSIDTWVLNEILINRADQIAECEDFEISINLSPASIASTNFIAMLDNYLKETSIPSRNIGFELKETTLLSDVNAAQEFLQVLEKHDCFVSMDNFGKGFGTFQYLKHFNKLYIKIDGKFIRNIHENDVDKAIVESINDLAHKLGAHTIAEFVETEEIIKYAKEIGIDYAQGYAIAKSEPLEKVMEAFKATEDA